MIRSCISNWYCSAMWLVSKFYFHTTCFGKLNPLWWAYSSKWVAQAPFLHPNGCLMLVVLQQKSGGVTKTTAWFSKMEQNQTKHCTSWFSYPWHPCMVYFTYIYHRFKPDLDKYTIHGCYGIGDLFFFAVITIWLCGFCVSKMGLWFGMWALHIMDLSYILSMFSTRPAEMIQRGLGVEFHGQT